MIDRNPRYRDATDREVIGFVRHANLDAFWSKEPITMVGNLKELTRVQGTYRRLGFRLVVSPMEPWPVADLVGIKAAIIVLDRLLDRGNMTICPVEHILENQGLCY